MAKSIALATLIPFGYKILMDFFLFNEIDPTDVRLSGTLYACTDIAGLFIVPRHSKSTLIHHLTVTGMALYNLTSTLEGIWQGFAVYGAFCTFTFLVNTTLSLRSTLHTESLRNCCIVSFSVYSLVCLLNWASQIYFVRNYFNYDGESCVFVGFILFIVFDDLTLMDWLLKKSKKQQSIKTN